MGSTRALWNAFLVFRRRTRIPFASKFPEMVSISFTGPLTTWWVPLSPEMLSPIPADAALCACTAAATRAEGANTAAIAPSAIPDISAPRAQAKRMPSSRLNTPAACAAASSPTL